MMNDLRGMQVVIQKKPRMMIQNEAATWFPFRILKKKMENL